MSTEKQLSVMISEENHNFINEFRDWKNESPTPGQLGRANRQNVVDMLLSEARIKYQKILNKEQDND